MQPRVLLRQFIVLLLVSTRNSSLEGPHHWMFPLEMSR
uniref:Uncharacterized protein n=1 Tax=Rhizophora mucronata TaxID=61149 RepID=A0A2P2N3B3_RHIMU